MTVFRELGSEFRFGAWVCLGVKIGIDWVQSGSRACWDAFCHHRSFHSKHSTDGREKNTAPSNAAATVSGVTHTHAAHGRRPKLKACCGEKACGC